MVKQKFLNLVISILVVASLLFGGINQANAQEQDPTVPQGKGQTQDPTLPADVTLTDRVTPAERQAAADRNTALGLLPGLAKPLPVTTVKRGPAPDPTVVPHYFGPFANYANSPLPKGSIASIAVEDGGAGYSATPTVSIYDVYGTGMDASATATVVGGVITAITVDTAGVDYSAPIVVIDDTTGSGAVASPVLGSLTGGLRKFVDALPGLDPNTPNGLGQYIPVATPDTVTFPGADYYEIELVEYTEQLHSDLPPTTLRGYHQTNYGTDPNVVNPTLADNTIAPPAIPHYLGPIIVSTKDKPVRIKFTNNLPTGAGGDLFIPVDTSVMGAGEGNLDASGLPCNRDTQVCAEYSDNRGTLHLHGGLVPWISDGTPHQWTTPAGEDTKYPTGVSTEYVPDMWFDASGNVIPNTVGQTTPPFPGATNNPSGAASINGEGSMTFYYNNQQSARLQFYHDHAYGITRLNVYAGEVAGYLITDEIEQDLINGTNDSGVNPGFVQALPGIGIPLIFQDKTFVDAETIPAQDPTWRWGTGEIVNGRRVPNTGDLWLPSVYMPIQNPWDPAAGANAYGRWQYGPWFWPPTENILNGPVANEYYDPGCDPALTWCEPPMRNDSPNPSMGMEAYMDTSLVNGTVYPFLEVDPKAYRFRILNGANDRFYNLSMFVAVDAVGNPCDLATNPTPVAESTGVTCTEVGMIDAIAQPGFPANWPNDSRAGGAPDPANLGPSWIQIGTEGGFLPAPVVIPPQPITFQGNPGLFNVGNVLDHSLLLGNAERADVIVDFSQYAGKTIIVYNDAPTAFPALDPRYDYYTGNPSQMDSGGAPTTQPGYGPNTRTVMQIRVANTTPAAPYDVNALNAVFAKDTASNKRGVFEKGQSPIIVPQAAYNSAYDASFPSDASQYVKITDRSMTFTPLGSNTPVTISFQEKAIHDEMGASYDQEFGRMSGNLGLELPGTNNLNQNIILYGYASPPVDFLADSPGMSQTQIGTLQDGTTLWKITHNGVDTHPIHIHLANAQLINRVGWDGLLLPPDANELGWKETIRINPLESTIWAVRPELPTQPFDIPNSERLIDPTLPVGAELMGPPGGFIDPALNAVTVLNHVVNYGWEYVWHCHILSHEEMDMMHSLVYAVTPVAPSGLTASGTGSTVNLQWLDNSVNETAFTIQRSTDGVTWTDIVVASSTGPAKGGTVSYSDTGRTPGTLYMYRVMATNTVGDTALYANSVGFPTVTKNSDPSNTAANMVAVSSILREALAANPTNAASVNFTVTFSQAVTGVDATDFTTAVTGAITGESVSGVTGSGTTYTVTVNTGTGSGTLGLNLINDGSIPGLGGAYTGGELYTIEKDGPSVVSVDRTAGFANPSNLTGVNFTVTFDKPVTGVDVTDFSVAATGLTGASVKSVAGSGTTYTVTALTGTGTGTLGLDVLNDGTVLDGTSTALNGAFTTSQVYDIDTVPPTTVSVLRASADPTSSATVDYTVTFSEAVTGVDKGDFSLTTSGITGPSVANVVGSGTTYTVTVNTGVGDSGTLRLNLKDNNSILDAVGNSLGGLGFNHYLLGESYTIAKPLMPLSVVRLNANPNALATVTFQVTFSRNVTGVDVSDFSVSNAGTTAPGVSVTTVTPVTAAKYNVDVNTGAGSGTIRLDVVDDNTIFEGVNPLGGTTSTSDGNFTTGQSYTIDRIPPVVSSYTLLNTNPNNRTSVAFTLIFSKSVTGVDVNDFALTTTGGITGASVSGVTGAGSTRTVTVNTGTGDGTIRLDVIDNDSIVDTLGNLLGGAGAGNGNYTTGQSYTIIKTSPSVISSVRLNSSPTSLDTVFFSVTFSESVVGVDVADFSLTNSGTIAGASVASVSGTGTTRTVAVSTGTGSGTILLNVADNDTILDIAGNILGGAGTGNGNYTAGEMYTVDKTVPTVVSSTRLNASPSSQGTVFYTVTFSETVGGVDAADFTLTTTGGIAGASVGSVSGTGTTRIVGIFTGTGSGTIRLDVVDNGSIVDTANNPLGGAGVQNYTAGQVYTLDKIAPTVVSSTRSNASPSSQGTVFYTVTFSETVSGVDAADFTLTTTGGITGATVASVSGSGATRTVGINTGTGSGTIRLDVVDNNTIVDVVANPLGGAGAQDFTTGQVYTIDKTVPTVVSIVRLSPNPTSLATVFYRVTFSETVTGVNASDFALTNTGTIAGTSIASVAGSGTTYTVTVNTGTGSGTIRLDVVDNDSIRDAAANRLGGTGNGNGDFTTGEVYNVR